MKENVFLVIGLGTFGMRVCEVLAEKGGKVIAVDNAENKIERVKDKVTQAILLDSTDEETLTNLPVEDVDIAIIAIGEDLEASIISTALLKNAGVPYIVARSISDIHQQILKQVGADEILNVEIDEGERLALKLISPQVLDRIPLTKEMSLAEVYCPAAFLGKKLIQLDIRKKLHLNIIAIKRPQLSVDEIGNPVSRENVIFPEAEEILQEDDILLLVGRNQDLDIIKEL